MIDLRSDTVTRPTAAMRAVMAAAEVGDDIYGEDPSARALEATIAERLGKEAALFVPSGTMGNQIAIALHCRPGDDVVVGEASHTVLYESGAAGALAGVQFTVAGTGGRFSASELDAACHPVGAFYMPRTRLVALENTHNRAGGTLWPLREIEAVASRAREIGLSMHLDGARLFNAAVASGIDEARYAASFDSVSVCFSKGLGAPVGSALVGGRAFIEEARRRRKMLGGAMRQVGVLCAAALFALEHHRDRLAEDHENARRLAEGLTRLGMNIDLARVETNIVNVLVDDAKEFVDAARGVGVALGAMSSTSVRAVTHLDVDRAAIDRAIECLAKVAS